MKLRALRIAAGAAVLLVMLVLLARLVPHYLRNLEFRNAMTGVLQQVADSKGTDETIVFGVLDQAARLGLHVDDKDIRVRRAPGRLEVELRYDVPVGLPLYSVDLHFRPRARVP